MANPLLDRAAPAFLAGRKQAIEIVEELSTFERLAGIVEQDLAALDERERPAGWRNSAVNLVLLFGWADSREQLPQLTGHADVAVPAVCQRCLGSCTLSLSVDLRVLLLRDSAAEPGNDDSLEIWELEEETLRPIDVVEEMLVMALPMAALHENRADCAALASPAAEAAPDTVRPFADLRARIDESR